MEILTDIKLSETEAKFFKKFKNLSVNETPLSQGQGIIKISPFDDYILFTLYDEINGTDSPIDLSNVGTLFLVFIGKNDQIRIPNFTNVKDIDMSQGQVLFRIDKDDSQKILELDNNSFYISSMMTDNEGSSDESVIYTGKFISLQESGEQFITNQLEEAQLEFSKELAKLQETINKLNTDLVNRNNLLAEQEVVIESLRQSNQNLSNEIAIISETSSSEIKTLLQEAKDAQKQEDNLKKNRQQILSKEEVKISQETKSRRSSFFKQASKQLRNNITKVNPITI